MKYISVAIENSVTGMDRLYTYACRDEDVRPGDCVYIPFGTSDGRRRGYVFEVKDKTEFDTEKIKEVIGVEKGLLSQEAVFLCAFMKERYLCRYIDGVKCFIPSGYFMYENSHPYWVEDRLQHSEKRYRKRRTYRCAHREENVRYSKLDYTENKYSADRPGGKFYRI